MEPIVQCCFTSTETVQTIRDVSPLFSVALHPQRPYRLLGTGRPGRAPLLSHSSLLLFEESKDVFNRGQCISMLLLKISSVAMEGNGAQSVMCGKGDWTDDWNVYQYVMEVFSFICHKSFVKMQLTKGVNRRFYHTENLGINKYITAMDKTKDMQQCTTNCPKYHSLNKKSTYAQMTHLP